MRILKGLTGGVTLFVSSIALAQADETGWTMQYSDGEALQKLLYVAKGQVHGDLYLRCRPGEGWIFLIHDKPANPNNTTKVQSAGKSVTLISRREYSEVDGDFYLDNAIPANDAVIDQFVAGNALVVDGIRYPINSATEQQTIANFVKICER